MKNTLLPIANARSGSMLFCMKLASESSAPIVPSTRPGWNENSMIILRVG
jgi:hypothetical protein